MSGAPDALVDFHTGDYTHCVNHPESTRGERPAHWTNREGWDKDTKVPPKATDTTV